MICIGGDRGGLCGRMGGGKIGYSYFDKDIDDSIEAIGESTNNPTITSTKGVTTAELQGENVWKWLNWGIVQSGVEVGYKFVAPESGKYPTLVAGSIADSEKAKPSK